MKLRCIKVDGEVETIAGEYTTTHSIATNLKLLVVKTHAQADDLYAILERVRDGLSDPSDAEWDEFIRDAKEVCEDVTNDA